MTDFVTPKSSQMDTHKFIINMPLKIIQSDKEKQAINSLF